jgi:glycosyltransferase involved in cell wall biosynthesis
MDSGNEIPFFVFLGSQGKFFVLNGVHFFKRTNLNTYLQARWEKQGGMIPNWQKILEDKNSIKNYHIKTLLEIKDSIKKLDFSDQWKSEIKEKANKLIIKHYKKMIESAEDPQNKEKIFIGMPVYNGERFIHGAINSIINQTYTNWILFISDNNSEDKTFEIAQYFSNKDPRIVCVKKWNNIGAIKNFEFTLKSSYCNYFKWMAHDDILEDTFLEKCIYELRKDKDIMFACTGIRNIDSFNRTIRNYPGFHTLATNSITKNVKKFLLQPEILGKANLIYSVFRTEFCKDIWDVIQLPECWGGDMVFMLAAIARGKYKIIPDVLFNKRYCRETDSPERIDTITINDPENHIFPLEKYEEYKNALLRATLNTKYYFLTEKIMEKRYQKALSRQ